MAHDIHGNNIDNCESNNAIWDYIQSLELRILELEQLTKKLQSN